MEVSDDENMFEFSATFSVKGASKIEFIFHESKKEISRSASMDRGRGLKASSSPSIFV